MTDTAFPGADTLMLFKTPAVAEPRVIPTRTSVCVEAVGAWPDNTTMVSDVAPGAVVSAPKRVDAEPEEVLVLIAEGIAVPKKPLG